MQDIFEQVDEQLEAERLHKYWQANRNRLLAALLLFFMLLFAYVGWQEYQARQDSAAAELFMRLQDRLNKQENEAAQKELQTLLGSHAGHSYAQFGRLLQARLLATAGNRSGALEQLTLLIQESHTPLLQDLALLNAAYLTAEKPEQAEPFLQRISSHSPYRAHALELQGLLAAQRGDSAAALAHYRDARAVAGEGSLRNRLESRLEQMGGEKKP
ncbi:MAG: tetratricopeptide repeat protein [Magnetococcales bacterium]|nr:tetratricopeptide repeat protein [Magnetococcales bacterium]